jgi:gamma-glutamyltranspeptidase/glutathione hydrolase
MKHSIITALSLIILLSCDSGLRVQKLLPGKQKKNYEKFSQKFVVASQGENTSKSAIEIMQKGGNIIDAAIAASFSISVERPHSSGLGGGGFLIYYRASDQKTFVYDFRETGPRYFHPKIFVDKEGKQIVDKSRTGAFAIGIPGLVKGLATIHREHGKIDFKKTVDPAIRLAKQGLTVYPALHKAIDSSKERLSKFKDSKKIFLNDKQMPWPIGHRLIQRDLATTLEKIAASYGDDFYSGETAQKIVKSLNSHGAQLKIENLKSYTVKKREPIVGTYKNYEIVSMPPPSSGGTHIIQILNILENIDLKKLGVQSPQAIHYTAASMQLAFRDRQTYMGDTDFVEVPLKKLISKKYAKNLFKMIPEKRALKFQEIADSIPKKIEPDHTTHFSLMDADGNVVVSTQTINGWFGSALVAEGTGIVMNNEMDDFAASADGVNLFGALGGKNNLPQYNKRPLSSMSPTIVFKGGRPLLALGTPSGTRILTCVAQVILNYIEYEMPLWESVAASRIHHQWYPDQLRMGPPMLKKETREALKKMGYELNDKSLGCKIQAIAKEGEVLHGVSDPREEGAVKTL